MVAASAALAYLKKAMCVMFYIVPISELTLGEGDKAPKYLLHYGIPMFFFFILVEFVILEALRFLGYSVGGSRPGSKGAAPKGGPATYRLNDFLACTIAGSFQQIGLLLFELIGLNFETTTYQWVYENFRFATIDAKEYPLFVYAALLLGKDFGYYWAHRSMHEWHVMWVGHSVHHSGEDYNMATGLRQGFTQPMLGWVFYAPLALCGFHPSAFSAHAQLNTLYMFWIHTDLVERLPLGLEYVFNSPMAHRMHHRPPGNCNYAGMLIVWDRLFGTFVPEVTRMDVYGLPNKEQPNTFDPLKLNANHVACLARNGRFDKKAAAAAGADANNDNSTSFGAAVWSVLRSLVRKRVSHPAVCDPRLLFKKIPPVRGDQRAEPKRLKWNGERPQSFLDSAFTAVAGFAVAVAGVGLLLNSKSMHAADAASCIVVWGLAASAVMRFADRKEHGGGEASRAAGQAVFLLPVLCGIMLKRPLEAALSPP